MHIEYWGLRFHHSLSLGDFQRARWSNRRPLKKVYHAMEFSFVQFVVHVLNHRLCTVCQVEIQENTDFLAEFLGQFCDKIPNDAEMEDWFRAMSTHMHLVSITYWWSIFLSLHLPCHASVTRRHWVSQASTMDWIPSLAIHWQSTLFLAGSLIELACCLAILAHHPLIDQNMSFL